MKFASSLFRITVTWLVATAMIATTLGVVITATAEAATTPYAATGRLNVRSGPSTSKTTVYTTLNKGDVILATGKVSKEWLPIKFNGKTAYVFAQFVKKTTSNNPRVTGTAGTMYTKVNVNQRSGASLSSKIIKVLKKGTKVSVTGRSLGDFSEVSDGGTLRWLYTEYLSSSATSADPEPSDEIEPDPTPDSATSATAKTTAVLTLRKSAIQTASSLGNVPEGATVTLTGNHDDAYSEVVYNKIKGWILTGYFTVVSTASGIKLSIPVATGKLYVNATGVNMRTDSNVESAKVAVLTYGTALATTGLQRNKYSSVIWDGKIRWVYTQYTQTKAIDATADLGSTTLNRLERYGKAAVLEVRENFPEIKTIGGWRSSSSYSSDHPNGRAIDIMIPNYKKNKALGDKIAAWVIKNGQRLHVTYLIWYQRNWRISRGKWVKMANRGSDNQNHKNHVHVSFYAS